MEPDPAKRTPVQVTRLNAIPATPAGASTQVLNAAWQAALRGTVWQYYELVTTQWPTLATPFATMESGGTYPEGSGTPFPQNGVTNTTMETYFQDATDAAGAGGNSCMSCHYRAGTIGFQLGPESPRALSRAHHPTRNIMSQDPNQPTNWWMYHGDPAHTGYVGNSSRITSQNVGASLKVLHQLQLRGPVMSVPAIVDGYVYVGTANSQEAAGANGGSFYKINLETGATQSTSGRSIRWSATRTALPGWPARPR